MQSNLANIVTCLQTNLDCNELGLYDVDIDHVLTS